MLSLLLTSLLQLVDLVLCTDVGNSIRVHILVIFLILHGVIFLLLVDEGIVEVL